MPDPLIEHEVTMPVTNPDTGRASRSFTFRGKLDWLLPKVHGGKIVDYKTSANPMKFLMGQRLGFQCELYALAAQQQEGITIAEWEYRIVTTPSLQIGKMKKYPTYDAFEAACYDWLKEKQERLITQSVLVNPTKQLQAQHYLWQCGQMILTNRRNNIWLPNTNACSDWSRTCEYMPLCLAVANGGDVDWLIEEEFEPKGSANPELSNKTLGDKTAITHSSMTTLNRCQLCYHWKFERGLQPKREESSTALWIGSAMHLGMEVFAKDGLDVALKAITEHTDNTSALGDELKNVQARGCKARAMVRAASERWGDNGSESQTTKP